MKTLGVVYEGRKATGSFCWSGKVADFGARDYLREHFQRALSALFNIRLSALQCYMHTQNSTCLRRFEWNPRGTPDASQVGMGMVGWGMLGMGVGLIKEKQLLTRECHRHIRANRTRRLIRNKKERVDVRNDEKSTIVVHLWLEIQVRFDDVYLFRKPVFVYFPRSKETQMKRQNRYVTPIVSFHAKYDYNYTWHFLLSRS